MARARRGWAVIASALATVAFAAVATAALGPATAIGTKVFGTADSAVRRAVVVGIDRYSAAPAPEPGSARAENPFAARAVSDLTNAVADASSFAALLRGRFGFEDENITLLLDEQATREGILTALRERLVEPSEPGDTAVFYFVGHGSRIVSSHPQASAGLDQTLVPFDSRSGARDIWDKELRAILGDVLDAGAQVTAVFGSCYSGDVTRGAGGTRARGSAPWIEVDAVSLYPELGLDERPAPGDRGALVLSAARPDQLATFVPKTVREGEDVRQISRGLFSWHLDQVLRTVPVDEPAERVFLRLRAAMRAEPYRQEPTLEPWGDREALARPLLGAPPPGVTGEVVVGVVAVDGDVVDLDGGHALGLATGCELELIGSGKLPVRVRVTEVVDLGKSRAQVIGGDGETIRPGLDLLGVTRWTAAQDAMLRVHVPAPLDGLATLESVLSQLAVDGTLRLVEDPTLERVSHWLRWQGESWELASFAGSVDLGATVEYDEILLGLIDESGARLFVQVPPTGSVATELEALAARSAIELVERDLADYELTGRLTDGRRAYAWCAPVELEGMPRRSEWVATEPLTELRADLRALARVRGWLTLQPPPDDGRFPYRLVVEQPSAREPGEPHVAANGEPYRLLIEADPGQLTRGVQGRFLYVLGIGGDDGGCTLLYSSPGRLPKASGSFANPEYPTTIELEDAIPLVGTGQGSLDTFVLISSRTAITNVGALAWAPVRDADPIAGPDLQVRSAGDLAALLGGVNAGVRAAGTVPDAWSLSTAQVRGGDAFPAPGDYEVWVHGFQPRDERDNPTCVNRFVAPRAGQLSVTGIPGSNLADFDLRVERADGSQAGLAESSKNQVTTTLAVAAGEQLTIRVGGRLRDANSPYAVVDLRIDLED